MANDETTPKILRLDRSRTERAFIEEESLWDEEIGRMKKLITNHVQALKMHEGEKRREKLKEMPRLSIGIYGSPGSGKSSLVETFVEMVNNDDKPLLGKLPCNFYSLPVIKPNILAKDEHFFYKFLATALNEDRRKGEPRGARYRDSSILSPLQQTFQEVSEYLQVINEIERKPDDDPLGVSLDRLEQHESGVKLEAKMAGFIEQLADTLAGGNSSVIFMPVDDADMSMETLISAIGTCWRFLQHPRLIPIFTFTGRLAEELLRVHFEEKLKIKSSGASDDKLKEASTSLLITENMAIQHLGKIFPVRNRIRLGPASARVLGANYISSEYERIPEKDKQGDQTGKTGTKAGTKNEFEVLELVETVSKLLFGHARVPVVPAVRPPLRMVTLRRQVQIVDAMHAAGIESFLMNVKRQGEGGENKPDKCWGEAFDLATWTLLNTHRDVLKEIKMNLDDLYSWTPKGLRQVVLDSILQMDLDERRRLIKHWRYRTEDRRSQIISLLAANVFRPRMFGEEPTGDEPGAVGDWNDHLNLRKKSIGPDSEYNKSMVENKDSLLMSEGLLWFINLCIGFYVPQILASNRLGKGAKTDTAKLRTDSISGVGWDLTSGPIHAVREALKNGKTFSTGMLFLEPSELVKKFDPKSSDADVKIFLNIWCFYGYRKGRPWAAVSLWRGLGFIGQLLNVDIDSRNAQNDYHRRLMSVKALLWRHFESALVLGSLPKKYQKTDNNDSKDPDSIDLYDGRLRKLSNAEETLKVDLAVTKLAEKLVDWLDEFNKSGSPGNESEHRSEHRSERIFPMEPLKDEDITSNTKGLKLDSPQLQPYKRVWEWERCFTRRLHGEDIMNIFWQDLENKYYRKSFGTLTLNDILYDWFSVLEDYWSGCRGKIMIEKYKIRRSSKTGAGKEKKGELDFTWKQGESRLNELLKTCPILEDNDNLQDDLAEISVWKSSFFEEPLDGNEK